uniref:Pecanex-like protein n=1 Tax=Tetranychus urticae TaxID=32264 RepID=T1KY53_TETUR
MGSQLLSILRQGVWASLTGGWYYDQKQSHFSNLFHLYIWLLLLCLPLAIELCVKSYLNSQDHILVWSLYCLIIASIFTIIKLVNAYLHHLFDSGEYVVEEETTSPDDDESGGDKVDEKEGDKSSICYQSFDEASKTLNMETSSDTSKVCDIYVHSNGVANQHEHSLSNKSARNSIEGSTSRKLNRINSGKSSIRANNNSENGVIPGTSVVVYQPLAANDLPSPSTSQAIVPSSPTSVKSVDGPPSYLLARILATPGTHLARSNDDTSTGAVHCFQDECGTWLTYIFDENSIGTAKTLVNSESKPYFADIPSASGLPSNRSNADKWASDSSESSDSSDSLTVMEKTHPESGSKSNTQHQRLAIGEKCSINNTFSPQLETQFLRSPSINSMFTETNAISFPMSMNPRFGSSPNIVITSDRHVSFSTNLNSPEYANLSFRLPIRYNDFISPAKPKQYYKLWIPPCFQWRYVKIRFDRLNLLTLLDRSLTRFELISSIFLAVLVAVLGSIIIEKGFFTDLWLFIFCLVICSSQYTLLKSVQPDAASPAHGYNRIIIYSRPIYFSIVCSIILLSRYYLDNNLKYSVNFYDFNFMDPSVIRAIEEGAKICILSFPIIFSFGLLPQINTFLMYTMEQIDIHVFGGTAFTTGLTSACYCIIRSISIVLILYAIALTSLLRVTNRQRASTVLTYHDYDVLFSIFCSLLVFFAYFMSRQTSDPTIVFSLIRRYIICGGLSLNQKSKNQANRGIGNSSNPSNDIDARQEDDEDGNPIQKEYVDPLPGKLEKILLTRLENDVILAILMTIIFFAIHSCLGSFLHHLS